MTKTLNIQASKVFLKNYSAEKRIVVNRGGSSSGKTGSLLRLVLFWLVTGKIDNTKKTFESGVLSVVRKFSTNLRTSCLRDWENILDEYGVRGNIKINKTDRTYTLGKRTVEFIGIDDPQKARGPRRDILYCNEANELQYEDFRQLAMRTKHRIFIDFNPDDEDVWINTELEQKRARNKGDVEVFVSTYRDNPFLSVEIIEEIESFRDADPAYWQVFGLGQYGRLEGRIFDFEEIPEVPKTAKLLGYGLDFGYTNDPTACVAVYLQNGNELILDEIIYERGLTNPDIARMLKNQGVSPTDDILADSSEPKSIDEIKVYGLNIYGVQKGADSVNFGIQIMRHYNIFVTSRSVNLLKEGRKYIWKKDKDGKALNTPIDQNNHAIDAARYLIMTRLAPKEEAPEKKAFLFRKKRR